MVEQVIRSTGGQSGGGGRPTTGQVDDLFGSS